MSQRDYAICYRVFRRIDQLAQDKYTNDRHTALTLWKLLGALEYKVFGSYGITGAEL